MNIDKLIKGHHFLQEGNPAWGESGEYKPINERLENAIPKCGNKLISMKARELRTLSNKTPFDKQQFYNTLNRCAERGEKIHLVSPLDAMLLTDEFIIELINNGFGIKSFIDNSFGGLEGKIITW